MSAGRSPGEDFQRVVSDARSGVASVARRLGGLAEAFATVGNERVAEDLEDLAHQLLAVSRQLGGGYDEYLTGELRTAQAGVAGTLKAILDMSPERAKQLLGEG